MVLKSVGTAISSHLRGRVDTVGSGRAGGIRTASLDLVQRIRDVPRPSFQQRNVDEDFVFTASDLIEGGITGGLAQPNGPLSIADFVEAGNAFGSKVGVEMLPAAVLQCLNQRTAKALVVHRTAPQEKAAVSRCLTVVARTLR